MICSKCGENKENLTGALVDNVFGQYCDRCINLVKRPASASSAQYARDRDREAHEADLIQPWLPSGQVNSEFVRMYPEESRDMFSQTELEQM